MRTHMDVAQFFSSWEGMKKGNNEAMGVNFCSPMACGVRIKAVCYFINAVLFLRFLLKKGRIQPWATERSSHRILQLPGLVVLNTILKPLFRTI